MKQTNRIRKSVERWLTDTDIMNIRKRIPHREIAPLNATPEQEAEVAERNKKAMNDQMRANFTAMLDAILEDHAEETVEIMALCCFIEPQDIDNHPMSEYLKAMTELMNDESVVGFFTSLVRWGQTAMRNA